MEYCGILGAPWNPVGTQQSPSESHRSISESSQTQAENLGLLQKYPVYIVTPQNPHGIIWNYPESSGIPHNPLEPLRNSAEPLGDIPEYTGVLLTSLELIGTIRSQSELSGSIQKRSEPFGTHWDNHCAQNSAE